MALNLASCFLLFSSLTPLFTTVGAQERAPHGLVYENPVAFSPAAYDFFHPKAQQQQEQSKTINLCVTCSPLPLAAHVEATQGHESKEEMTKSGGGLGGGAIAGIVFGLAFVAVFAMGAYYVVISRKSSMVQAKADSVQADA